MSNTRNSIISNSALMKSVVTDILAGVNDAKISKMYDVSAMSIGRIRRGEVGAVEFLDAAAQIAIETGDKKQLSICNDLTAQIEEVRLTHEQRLKDLQVFLDSSFAAMRKGSK